MCIFQRENNCGNVRKSTLIIILSLFVFVAYGQVCVDGNYCPNPNLPGGVNCVGEILDEWAPASSSGQLSTISTSTCNIQEIFGYSQSSNFYLGLEVGDSGGAFFYIYLNVDCDSANNDQCHNGADFRTKFRIKNDGLIEVFALQEYTGADPSTNSSNSFCMDDNATGSGIGGEYSTVLSSSVITKKGNIDGCSGADKIWVEIGFDINSIFNPCDPLSTCGLIEITAITSQAGEFENSIDCETFNVAVSIPVNAPPTAIIDPVSSCLYSDADVCLNGSSSTDPDNNIQAYQWDFDYDGLNFDINATGSMVCHTYAPGSYTAALRVIDSFSCADIAVTDLVDFIVEDGANKVTATCTDGIVNCETDVNGSVSVTATGGTANYSYQWSNGGTNAAETGLGVGEYSVTVTDLNGCFDVCSAEINSGQLSCSIIQSACNLNNLRSAISSVSGGAMPYEYNWSNGATTTSIDNLQAGSYMLTIVDINDCEVACEIVIDQCFRCDTTCETAFARLDGFENCFSQYGFTDWGWTNGLLLEGTYTLDLYANAQQCNLNMADLAGELIVDYNDDTVMVIYELFSNFLLNFTNVYVGCDAIPINPLTGNETILPGEYPNQHNITNKKRDTFFIDVSSLPCEGIYLIAQAEICRPNPMTCNVTGVDAVCFEDNSGSTNATVNGGNPPYSFLWSTGAMTEDIAAMSGGTYTLSVTDAGNCLTTCAVTIGQPPALTCGIVGTNVACNSNGTGDADATVTGGSPLYNYQWSNGATTEDLSNLTVGSYSLSVTDANSCMSTCEVNIDGLICSIEQSDCDNKYLRSAISNVIGGDVPYTYLWSTGETTPAIHDLVPGNYQLLVTDVNECETECEIVIDRCNVCDAKCRTSFARLDGKENCFNQYGFDQWGWTNGLLSEGLYQFDLYADALQCDLNVGELVGQVMVDYDGDSVKISYNMYSDYFMTLVSIYVGCDIIPRNNGVEVVAPSQYPLQQIVNERATFSAVIPVNQLPCEGVYIIAHAEVCEPNPMTCSIIGTNVDCNAGSAGFAAASVDGGQAPYNYSWSTGQTTNVVGGLVEGIYNLTVIDANGCTSTCEVWIAHDRLNVTPIGPFCQNDAPFDLSPLLTDPNLLGTWIGDGVIDEIFYPSNLTIGSHTIYYDDEITCQSASLDITITKSCCPLDYLQANGRMLIGKQQSAVHYETDGILQSIQTVHANTIYDSKVEICLFGDFEVKLGTTFDAIIDGCP